MQMTRRAFTLLEVLISITLLSLVLMALYKSTDLLHRSNQHLYHHLEQAANSIKGVQTLYMDILQADHNITVNQEKEFHQLIIENTGHSLYGLPRAKVAWLVYKDDNTLLRVEGSEYSLPLKNEEKVEVDPILKDMEIFQVYKSKNKDKILVLLQVKGSDPQSFMVQGISQPPAVQTTNPNNPNQPLNQPQNPNIIQ